MVRMVRKYLKSGYYLATSVFIVLTLIEMFVYLKMYSNILGMLYLFINYFIMFLLISLCFNYEKSNRNIRFSKILISIVLGILSSFIISLFVPYIISYTDSSYVFEEKIYVVSKILKPIVYLVFGYLTYKEFDFKISNIKVKISKILTK